MLRHAPGADYELILLSDHGQTPGYPLHEPFRGHPRRRGQRLSAKKIRSGRFCRRPGFHRMQLGYLQEELEARPEELAPPPLFTGDKNSLQRRIRELVPETLKIDAEGGVVITYSSSLAHLYITGEPRRLSWKEIEAAYPLLLRFLCRHRGSASSWPGARTARSVSSPATESRSACAPALPPPRKTRLSAPLRRPAELFPDLCRFAARTPAAT